jgi:alginate O-acetyltransferase complex protein AlgI
MVFNSLHFVAFFLVVYALYRVLPFRAQNVLLLAASYYFYAAWDWRFVSLLVASTLVNYAAGRALGGDRPPRARRFILGGALAFNLALLGFFKYWNFFADNVRALFALAGWHADPFTVTVLLPIGISFYTFMTMSYVIDVYRKEVAPSTCLIEFGVFVAYFPHLVAGPILRASLLLPQIARPRTITAEQVADGVWLLLWGYFKKVFVADNLARVTAVVFDPASAPAGLDVVLGTVAFAFQIYGDFSGYSDIARGLSKLLGIELNINFRFPYAVRTPQEFWAHWHISLSTWLRDYLFLPLSFAWSRRLDGVRWLGLRDEFWIYSTATVGTMLLGGLWHGAAWNFVAWGAYQGLLLVAFRAVAEWRRAKGLRRRRTAWSLTLADAPAVVGMFGLTCAGWLIFRASSLAHAGRLAGRIATSFMPAPGTEWAVLLPILLYAGPMLVVHLAEARADTLDVVRRWRPVLRYSVYVALAYLIVLFGDFEGSEFIYFQF